MNQEEYQRKVAELDAQQDDSQHLFHQNSIELEEQFDQIEKEIKNQIEINNQKISDFNAFAPKAISQIEELQNNLGGFVEFNYQYSASKIYDSYQENIRIFNDENNQLEEKLTDNNREFDDQLEQLTDKHFSTMHQLDDQIDDLKDKFYRD